MFFIILFRLVVWHTWGHVILLTKIGSGDRSERIRTYNYPQGRVTDHRVGITQHSIENIMQGEGLDHFIDALISKQEEEALASLKVVG
jgi:peptide chain release factor 1